jgi:alanine-synthesizing transaminase
MFLQRLIELKILLEQKGKDIIDFGMGNPDIPTPKHIVDKLVETSLDPKMHRYSASRGISGLKKGKCKIL